jgi:hypothetical protein
MPKQAAIAHSLIQKIHPYFSKNDQKTDNKTTCRSFLKLVFGLPSDAVSGVLV